MNVKSDKFMMGYIDKELSVNEYDEIEKGLSKQDKHRFDKEATFEEVISEKISEEVRCPDKLWEGLKDKIGANSAKQKRIKFIYKMVASIAIVIGAVLFMNKDRINLYQHQKVINNSINKFFDGEASLTTIASIQKVFDKNNIKITLAMKEDGCLMPNCDMSHLSGGCSIKSLGGKETEDAIILGFYCPGCKYPTKLIVYKNRKDIETKKGEYVKTIGNYQMVAISKHNPKQLFELITKKTGVI